MDHSHVHDADADGDGESCGMIMTFHGGHCESILFSEWTPKEIGPFIGSTIAIFIASILYEGLKYYREVIYAADARQQLAYIQQNKEGNNAIIVHKRSFRENITSKYHLIQTILHLIQVSVSYLLMLVAMTYNVWLFLAIILGAATGYFFFGWIKSSSSTDFTEHCH